VTPASAPLTRVCLLRRLAIVRAAIPRIVPARIDSKGKPGTGGNASGVETVIELDVDEVACVVEAVLVSVVVTKLDVLATIVGCVTVADVLVGFSEVVLLVAAVV